MKYFEWQTDYELYCKKHSTGMFDDNIEDLVNDIALGRPVTRKRKKQKPPRYEDFYPRRRREIIQCGTPPIRLESEHVWVQCKRPFYSVHPKIASRLCRVDLNKIPANLIKMPGDLKAVHIRFSEAHEEFTLHDPIKADNKRGEVPAGSFVRGFLMVDNRNTESESSITHAAGIGNIAFVFDLGVSFDYGNQQQPVYPIFGIVPEEGKSLSEAIAHNKRPDRPQSYNDIIENTLKLAVTVGFLSDNPSVCKADVLSADRSRFDNAEEDERQRLIDRAHRKGKVGFTIGSDEMFAASGSTGKSTGEGSGLQYAHIRGGHPRAVRYGTGLSKVKIEWIQPTVVREDLPFKS